MDADSHPSIDFTCWLLGILMDLKVPAKGHLISSPKLDTRNSFKLVNKTLFENLHLCLTKLSRTDEQKLLNILTCILQHVYIDVSNDTVGLKKIIKHVHQKLESQYNSELTDKAKSSYLHALVQCAMSLYTNSKSKTSQDKGSVKFDTNESLSGFISLRNNNTCAYVTKGSEVYKYITCSNGGGTIAEWHFQLSEILAANAIVGVQFINETSRIALNIEKGKVM